jgi:hypothetical protein
MFVYDFVTLDRPFCSVADSLTVDPGAGPLARAVAATSARLSPANGDMHPDHLEVGAPRSFEDTVVVPIRWTPGSGHVPFEHLDGFLQVSPFDPDGSHMSVSASCDEPRTGLGRRRDSQRIQRETEAGVRVLLSELAAVIEQER